MEAFTAPSSFLYLREWKPEQQEHTASDGLGLAEAGNGQGREAWNKKTRVFKYKTFLFKIYGYGYLPMTQTGIS